MTGYASRCTKCGDGIVSEIPPSDLARPVCIPCWRAMRAQPNPQMHAEWLRDLAAWNDGPTHYAASVSEQGDVYPLCERRVVDLGVESWTDRAGEVTCAACASAVERFKQ